MDEVWCIIKDFPNYSISNYGNVVNNDTGKRLKPSLTKTGLVKVGLVLGGVQYTRSLALFVADAFLPPHPNEEYRIPIHLDNDRTNNVVTNLVWRPRCFAQRYSQQFGKMTLEHRMGPILDLDSEVVYPTIFDAAVHNGLLVEDIWRSIYRKKKVIETGQMFGIFK